MLKLNLRFLLGLVSLSVVLLVTAGISFADPDLMGSLKSWYHQKFESANDMITQSIETELEIQKERLREEIQIKIDLSNAELHRFTREQAELYRQSLIKHADTLISNLNITNEDDRIQMEAKMNEIMISAKQAMQNLADSYIAPQLVFTPSPIDNKQEEIEVPIEDESASPSEDL